MSGIYQIAGISVIMLLMMYALAAIIDNMDQKEARDQFIAWALVLAIIISKAIW